MTKEVVIDLQGAPEAYRDFIAIRNGNIASVFAEVVKGEYRGEFSARSEGQYIIPATTITFEQARDLGIQTVEDFYGVAVQSIDEVGKAILHPSVSQESPAFHNARFAEKVKQLVLPGATGFTREDLLTAYNSNQLLSYDLRLKLPNESDGNGQYHITSYEQLAHLLDIVGTEFIAEHGMVLEAEVKNPETVSVGFLTLGGETYAFLAHQKNDIVTEQDETGDTYERSRYKGAYIAIMQSKDGIAGLLELPNLSHLEKDAIHAVSLFYQAYREEIGPMVSRISFDYLSGTDNQGNKLGGITDITGRLGGYCGALMLAVKELSQQEKGDRRDGVRYALGESTLNYQPDEVISEEENAMVIMEHPALRITARITAVV